MENLWIENYQKLNIAIQRNERLNKFMANFADIARLPAPKKKFHDLNETLKSVQTLMASNTNKLISWNWQLDSDEFRIMVDVQQFEMVMVNIIKNAIEAIGDNGKITIITENKPKRRLIIRDNGSGINEETQSKIFSPFYSTKKNGQGIGLTLTRDILINHDFSFSLKSDKSGYTEFCIEFAPENGI